MENKSLNIYLHHNFKIFIMKNLRSLSRESLKTLKGGGPFSPSEDTGCSYKCCSDRNPQICSKPITVSVEDSATVSCSAGSHVEPA